MNSVAHCEMVDAAEELSGGQNVISNVQSAKQDWCPELGCRVNLVCGIGHDGSAKSAGPRKSYPNIARHLSRDTLPPGSTQAGHDSYRDHCDSSGSNTLMLWKFFIMDQGTEFGADFQPLCQSRGVLLVVTDLETPWQNSVVERHGALFQMAFEKACSVEAPTTESEIDELIDFTLRL